MRTYKKVFDFNYFWILGKYLLDSAGSLVIKPGSLDNLEGKAYEFYIEANYQDSHYGHSIGIWIQNTPEVPIVSI